MKVKFGEKPSTESEDFFSSISSFNRRYREALAKVQDDKDLRQRQRTMFISNVTTDDTNVDG